METNTSWMTKEQMDAVIEWLDQECGYDEDQLICTRDTVKNFEDNFIDWKNKRETTVAGMPAFSYEKCQHRACERRFRFFIVDFGDFRATFKY